MPIDPSIALGYRGVEAPNPLAAYAQASQIQNAQNQNALAQYQLSAAQRKDAAEETVNRLYAQHFNTDTGKLDVNAFNAALVGAGQGAQIPVIQAKQQQIEAQNATINKTKSESAAARHKLAADMERDISQRPSDANITAYLEDVQQSDLFSPQEKTIISKKMQQILALPMDKRTEFLSMQGATAGDYVSKQNNANTVAATIRGQNMTDARARENIEIARERLAKDNATLDPAESAAISKAIIEGRLDPYKINGRNAKMMAQTLIAKPDVNIKDLGIEAAGAGAAERALSTQSAKMSTAANEAGKMINVAQTYSNNIDRTKYPTINAIQNAVDKGTGGEDIVKLNTALNALINSYARAISPTGNPTVSDKNHARDIVNASYSNGQLNGVFAVMQQEMQSARSATTETRAQLKSDRTGGAKPVAAPTGGIKFLGFE
jgi:hypothetical protein